MMEGLSMHPGAIRSRAKREAKRNAQGKERRAWAPMSAEARAVPRHVLEREQRIAYKRAKRNEKAATTRPHDAHVAVWRRRQPKPTEAVGLCDAHVKRWRGACRGAAFKHRYRTDPEFSTKQKVRARLRKTATLDGEVAAYLAARVKSGHAMAQAWADLLGYTVGQLTAHLKRTVPAGYTWHQFLDGTLEIDHILPRSSFDLTRVDEVRACWCLGNLRLLPAEINRAKRARIEVLL